MNAIPTTDDRGEYARVHYHARKRLDSSCRSCGSSQDLQAALSSEAAPGKLKRDPATGCLFSTDGSDYITLCYRCHRNLDIVQKRTHCAAGHEYAPGSFAIKKDGARRCLICHRQQEAARCADPVYRAKKYARARIPLTARQKERKLQLQRLRREAGNRVQWKAPR